MNQARRNVIYGDQASAGKPEKLNGREPRYTASGDMHAQDVALGYIEAGWPAKREG